MFREKDVRRLEIAMDEAATVHRRQRREHAACDVERLRHRQRTSSDSRRERLALEKLHGDVDPARILADFVELADVRVVDAGRDPRFPLQALAGLGPDVLRPHGLDGDRPIQAFVVPRIHDAHAAFAERTSDSIGTDRVWEMSSQAETRLANAPKFGEIQ